MSETTEYQEACYLAMTIYKRRYKTQSPDFEPCPDTLGVLTQIDNMVAGLFSDLDQAQCWTRIENGEKSTDAAPCAQKTAEFSDDEIIAAANGWREYDAPDGLSPIERMVYGACRAAIAADRKLRGDA